MTLTARDYLCALLNRRVRLTTDGSFGLEVCYGTLLDADDDWVVLQFTPEVVFPNPLLIARSRVTTITIANSDPEMKNTNR